MSQAPLPVNAAPQPLPPRTPELQPAEPSWPLVREWIAGRDLEDSEALEPLQEWRHGAAGGSTTRYIDDSAQFAAMRRAALA